MKGGLKWKTIVFSLIVTNSGKKFDCYVKKKIEFEEKEGDQQNINFSVVFAFIFVIVDRRDRAIDQGSELMIFQL